MNTILSSGGIHRILRQVLAVDPCLGSVYISKVDLSIIYMRLWVSLE